MPQWYFKSKLEQQEEERKKLQQIKFDKLYYENLRRMSETTISQKGKEKIGVKTRARNTKVSLPKFSWDNKGDKNGIDVD
jgi:hypothetical protein